MKRFKTFLLEALLLEVTSPEERARIQQAKVDSYVGKYMKHHKDHPTVRSNPEEAKKLIAASMPLQSSHEEAIYASRNFLDGILKPGEDDEVIRYGINRYRSAKKLGKFKEPLESHTHDSLMAALKTADPQKESTPGPKMDDLSHLKIGQIYHPEHGQLHVYHIHTDNVKDMSEFDQLSKRFKQHACVNNNFCTFYESLGGKHLKDYSHGHGMLYYVNNNNRIVFGHGFADRGIVNPDNTPVSNVEANIIQRQTSKLLQGRHKEIYDAITAIQHPNATPEHITKALNDEHEYVRELAIQHPNATQEHITQALNDRSEYVRAAAREALIKHPNATPEHITQALNDKHSEYIRQLAIQHPNATPEHITQALNDWSGYVRAAAIRHPNATQEHLTQALNDPRGGYVREVATEILIKRPNATPEHITRALNHTSLDVRKLAIQHPNATQEHITKALNDEDYEVRQLAIRHPNATKEHITKALNDEDFYIRADAIQHPNATPEHITQALNDEVSLVRKLAIRHPNATQEHITKALNDKHSGVREEARKKA